MADSGVLPVSFRQSCSPLRLARPPRRGPPMSESESPSLSLEETLRIMDVAAALRDQRKRAQRELGLGEVKQQLQDQLLQTARLTGEPLTAEDIEAAIQLYFDNLHAFHEPQPGLSTLAAHIYIRRTWILLLAVFVTITTGVIWLFTRGWSG